jgi:hypothetical protein
MTFPFISQILFSEELKTYRNKKTITKELIVFILIKAKEKQKQLNQINHHSLSVVYYEWK